MRDVFQREVHSPRPLLYIFDLLCRERDSAAREGTGRPAHPNRGSRFESLPLLPRPPLYPLHHSEKANPLYFPIFP